ncbi:hypothetical protein [Flavobacterium urocaniciphilum]|uniref:TonB protein C-terminal n=1 Tax=Flavobacterium urocaniciphilum TaxID=1299341 RepID=A0A1H9CSD9_9FLAO|nr:hypothetical protein [Flavobacterium urocaniciphilum]SEQ03523.1 hypothetical protein SAMN05444005_10528 [Flavobacterium urocaniciphilum]
MKSFYLQFLLFIVPFFAWSQTDDSILKEIKNEDIKVCFQKYLDQEKITLDFFTESAKLKENDSVIEISNIENIAYYDRAIQELNLLNKTKGELYNKFYYDKNQKDQAKIYKKIFKTDSLINANYVSRFKLLKTKFQNVKKPEDVDVIPTDVCQRLVSGNEMLMPLHDTCKNLNLSTKDEINCSANFIRNKVVQHIQKYLSDFEYGFNISVIIRFVIDSEGNVIFDNFLRCSGELKYDLVAYKGFKSFANSTVFCPAKHNDKNVSVYYNLPIKIVMEEY